MTERLSPKQLAEKIEVTPLSASHLMRCLILLTWMLLLSGFCTAKTDHLRLTTKITDERYCDAGFYEDMALLRLSIRLTFANDSARSLILYKGSNLVQYALVATDSQRLLNKEYELKDVM